MFLKLSKRSVQIRSEIVYKIENNLKELYEEGFWVEIFKTSRLSYL